MRWLDSFAMISLALVFKQCEWLLTYNHNIANFHLTYSGGAMASFALHSDDPEADPEQGGHVMLGGIIYQFVCLVVYCGFLCFQDLLSFCSYYPCSACIKCYLAQRALKGSCCNSIRCAHIPPASSIFAW